MKSTGKARLALMALILSLAVAAPVISAQTTEAVSEIKEITYQKVDDQLQVFIKIEGPFTFETLEISAPQRLVLDFHSVSKISAAPLLEVNDLGLTTIRAGQYQPEVARVVFDLNEKTPAHSLTQVENGLKVVFWMEPAQPEQPQEPVKPVVVKEQPVKQVKTEPVPATTEGKKGFFGRLAGGLAVYGVPETSAGKTFPVYGETLSLTEAYTLENTFKADLALGYYLTNSIRVGAGGSTQSLKTTSAIEASIPHPFPANPPRTVTFDPREYSASVTNIYVFGLFSLVKMDKFEVSAGPMVGYASAKYETLQDFDFQDKSPFQSTNITITPKYTEESVSSLNLGVWLALQYRVSGNLYLGLDARLVYFDVKILNIGKRANLSTIDLLLGLQYNF